MAVKMDSCEMTSNERENLNEPLEYVGFWPRFGASIIDSILLMLVTFPLLWLIYGGQYFSSEEGSQGVFDIILSYFLPIAATILFWIYKAATPGKMALSAVVVDEKTGGKPTANQAIIRYLGYYISLIPLGLGFIWVAIDKKKQGWHDKIAGTVVIYVNKH